MNQDQADYVTQKDIDDAKEMRGAGYERTEGRPNIKFVKIDIPDGEYCVGQPMNFCKQKRGDWCRLFINELERTAGGIPKKLIECLALKSTLPCGHHPDAEVGATFPRCVACEQEEK